MTGPSQPTPSESFFRQTEFFSFLVFFISAAVAAGEMLFGSYVALSLLALVFLIFYTLIITLLPLKILSGQNVFAIAAIVTIISGIAEAINSQTHLPFGECRWLDDFGPQLFHLIPAFMPFIWLIAVINSRGAARFLLRAWTGMPNWGLFVIALASLMCGVFFVAFGHFSRAMHLCAEPHSLWLSFVGHVGVTALMLIIAATWFINKRSGRSRAPDIYPLLVWLVSLALFMLRQLHS